MEFYEMKETSFVRRLVSWVVDIIVVIAIGWFTVYSFGSQVTVSGQSMVPLLEAEDVVLMNRLIYDFSDPKRFDVVVFQRGDSRANMKRVIGLPGETVQIKDGAVYIDGILLEAEDGLNQVALAGLAENPITLGEDEYFLLGDNRDSSEDSRFSNIGNVTKEQILGKVWLRILPIIELEII